MGPKKAVKTDSQAAEPATERPVKSTKKAATEPAKSAGEQVASKKHPSGMVMLQEALKALENRNGVSAHAVRAYITENYPTFDSIRLKYVVRRSLAKGLETGTVVRTANSANAAGAQGKFRLAKKEKAPANKENAGPNKPKAAKARKPKGEGSESKAVEKVKVLADQDEVVSNAKPKKAAKASAASSSKVAPAKKPKAKAAAAPDEGGPVEEEDYATTTTKKAAAKKGPQKAQNGAKDGEGKGGKKGGKNVAGKSPKSAEKDGEKAAKDGESKAAKKGAKDAEGKGGKDGAGKAQKAAEDGKGKRKRAAE